jgi:hypothetical protein
VLTILSQLGAAQHELVAETECGLSHFSVAAAGGEHLDREIELVLIGFEHVEQSGRQIANRQVGKVGKNRFKVLYLPVSLDLFEFVTYRYDFGLLIGGTMPLAR